MNILFFVESGHGNSALLTEQLIALHKQHKKVCGILSTKEQESGLIDKLNSLLIPNYILPGLAEHQSFKKDAIQLKKIIEEQLIDVVHIQTNWELALIIYVKYILGVCRKFKMVYTIHAYRNNKRYKSYLVRVLLTFFLAFFMDKVICMCTSLKNSFRWLSYKIAMIPLGVDENFFECPYQSLPIDKLRLIYPAQFRVGKNQDIVIRAFAEYRNMTRDMNSILILPGNGELLQKMKDLCKDLGCEQQVLFPGYCSKREILEYYKKSNNAVIASDSETFGLCIAEPFVLGLNIITTRVGVSSDIIRNKEGGFFFKTQEELKLIFLELSKNPLLIQQNGKRNFQMRDKFRWSIITKEYLKIINQIVSNGK